MQQTCVRFIFGCVACPAACRAGVKSGAPSLEGLQPEFGNTAGLNIQVFTDWQRLLSAIYIRDFDKQGSAVPNGVKLFMKEVVSATSYSSRLAVLMRQTPWKPLASPMLHMLDFTSTSSFYCT